MTHPALDAVGLEKRYRGRAVVAGVSFALGRGEVLGLIGPNGAGKTTTIRMISGATRPSAGRVTIDGHDLATDAIEARRRIGYLPEHAPLYDEMRVSDYLRLRARLKGVARADVHARVDGALERLDLGGVRRRVIGELSKGFRQRVGLAAAIVGRPVVLVLDEPTVGLDPAQGRQFRALIDELRADHAIVISSHALVELERLADRVVFIANGRQLVAGTTAALRARLPVGRVVMRALGVTDALVAELDDDARVVACAVERGADGSTSVALSVRDDDVQSWVGARAFAHGATVVELVAERPGLEALFHELLETDGAR